MMKPAYAFHWSIVAAIALAVAAIATPALAQTPYTDTPGLPDDASADRITAVLAAYNSGEAELIEKAVTEHFTGDFAEAPMHEHVGIWRRSLRDTGPLEALAHRTYDPPSENIVPIFKSTVTGAYHAFVLTAEQDDPHRFTGLYFAPARPPSFLEPGEGLRGRALYSAVDDLIDRLVEHEKFSGTVVIAKDGKPVYERAVGLASRRFDVPNRLDTKFNLGSMNKMFTATAIAQLADAGKLDFTDNIGAHLPDYPNEEVREKVQIQHLLSHTSGMGNHFTREFMEGSKFLYRDLDDYLDLFMDEELAFEPGTEWSYSNAGFYVLGMIIEAASGQTYYDYIRTNLYSPAGMIDSDSYDMDIPIKNLAIGYTTSSMAFDPEDDGARWLGANRWRNNYFLHSIKGGPAGGGFSTSPDLIAYASALRSHSCVSASSFELLTTPKPDLASPNYGFGFGVSESETTGRIVGHSGGFPGINAQLDIYLDLGYDVAVMANMDGSASLLAGRIKDFISGRP